MRTRILFLLTFAVACSGTERTTDIKDPGMTDVSGTGDAAALSAKAWCTRVYGNLRTYYARCFGGTAADWSRLVDDAFCTEIEDDVRAARLSFSAAKGSACNTAVGSASCGGTALDIAACDETFVGAIAAGESCTEQQHCIAGTRCMIAPDACSGSCTLVNEAGPGASCAEASCADGLFCQYNGTGDPICRAYGQAGATCDSTFECSEPLWCNDDGVCAQPLAAGAVCTSSFRQCADELVCAGPQGARACRTAKKVGDACTVGDEECVIGFCAMAGTCTFPPALGEACNDDGPEAAHCTTGFCSGGVCAMRKAVGQTCTFSDECASFDCNEGTCQAEMCPG
ncbi:MAG: hypothetical protein RMA76_07140 [Deltaproteobacteria bacterium]|jgi:hypothetical protein